MYLFPSFFVSLGCLRDTGATAACLFCSLCKLEKIQVELARLVCGELIEYNREVVSTHVSMQERDRERWDEPIV